MTIKDVAISRKRREKGLFSVERLEDRRLLAADATLPAYNAGTPIVTEIWVDPVAGDDARSGAVRQSAVRTVSEAWRRVPVGIPLSQGVRINLVAGTYAEDMVPNYWERRLGTATAPVIVRAADGVGTAKLPALNIFGCTHIHLQGLDVSARGGDVLHFEGCNYVLVRDTTVRGLGVIADYAVPQETLKANQCTHVYIENCDISGAWDNAVDFVAVQYGHVVGSRIHRAGDWAMYVKGGSASIVVAGNEFFDAGTGGFTAGQGTGFEWMVAPWLTYEAIDITFTRNVIHDTEGAGVGVNGGSNIMITNNVMYRVGARSHVIEVGFGSRSCDGDRARCAALLAQGGWGTDVVGVEVPIPNDRVTIASNVVLNPDGYVSRWQQFAIAGPRTAPAGSNVLSPARADTNLRIVDNIIWNGPASHELGVETPALAAVLRAGNAINTLRPVLVDPARGDYRLAPASPVPPGWNGSPLAPPVAPPPTLPPAPLPRLTAVFAAIPTTTARQLTAFTVTFNRTVRGVSLDDFRLLRGRIVLSLRGARLATTDNRTFTISGVRGTNLAGSYTLTLRAAGTGIVDSSAAGFATPAKVSWRMTRWA
ncbi:MAG: right-handed parallel beta-helix repeat-containing protein [Pirellulales bacterium]